MQYHFLGTSDLRISEICLGTMTFGQQNSLEEAHALLDVAFAGGVNSFDTAEMYPVPARARTQGQSETILGTWLQQKPRDQIIIATKIAGPSPRMPWIRGIDHRIDRPNLEQAVNASLQRLQTDYIDLYQIHWPDRYVALFGSPDYDPKLERDTVPIQEQLEALGELVKAGKIRYLGLSNETPWGVMEFVRLAEVLNLPRAVSIQNAFSLLNRVFHTHLAETCRVLNLGLLAYSPLAFGLLSGKHLQGPPATSRLALFPGFGIRYTKPNVEPAVAAYVALARHHGLTPAQLALAYVRSRWFVSSTIIGVTTLPQLEENLKCLEIVLGEEILAEIDAIHLQYPNPAP